MERIPLNLGRNRFTALPESGAAAQSGDRFGLGSDCCCCGHDRLVVRSVLASSSRVCLRRRWQVRSIHVMVAIRSSLRVSHRRRLRTFFGSSEKNDSMAALSAAEPTCPIDSTMRPRFSARRSLRDRSWLPQSESASIQQRHRHVERLRS